VNRTFSWRDDILGYLVFSGVYAVLIPGAIWCFIIAYGSDDWDVWVMVGLSIVILVAGFTRLRWDVWAGDGTHPVAQKRVAENVPQPGGKWEAQSTVKAGNTTTIDRPELTNPRRWQNKVPQVDWDTMYNSWAARGWLVPQGGRKSPRVRSVAMAHIRNYATTPPPGAG
jgi:hypothetical protein